MSEALVSGREHSLFGSEFAASAGTSKLPDETVENYAETLAASPEALRGSFEFYRAIPATAAQNEERKKRRSGSRCPSSRSAAQKAQWKASKRP